MKNFYEHQERAWSKSARLVAWFLLAASGTVVVTGIVLTYLFILLLVSLSLNLAEFQLQLAEIFLIICGVTALLIGLSSFQKMKQLRAGGQVIAKDLGGLRIEAPTSNRYHRRIQNIVQEMAVASGIPVPDVYVLPNQTGINAFAAGLTIDDVVIGVTQGCIERLNREQLQGVIAHEFSHIHNGDMRLNLKLVGLLHGLLGVSLFAEALLQAAQELACAPGHQRDAAGQMALAVLMGLAGIMLWPVGLVGTLFGMVVMSATSRQREYLADAYAVQFTRNPGGLAGALKVLSGCEAGSRVRSANTLEASHLLFAPGASWMVGLLATHPPLEERIRRLDPSWDGVPLFEDLDDFEEVDALAESPTSLGGTDAADRSKERDSSGRLRTLPPAPGLANVNSIGAGGPEGLDGIGVSSPALASPLMSGWHDLVSDGEGCFGVLLAVWIRQMQERTSSNDPLEEVLTGGLERLSIELDRLDEGTRLALFDLALRNTDRLTSSQRVQLQQRMQKHISNGLIDDPLQWAFVWQLRRCLESQPAPEVRPKYGRLSDVQPACELMLSALSHIGTEHEAMANYAFQRSVVHLGLREPRFWTLDEISSERMDVAAELLSELAPRPRQKLLAGLESALSADHEVSMAEAIFMRGLAAAMSMPLPELLPGRSTTKSDCLLRG